MALTQWVNWIRHQISTPPRVMSRQDWRFRAREKEEMVRTAFSFLHYEKTEGDYAEFGVFDGLFTFIPACLVSQAYKGPGAQPRRCHAFDSFQGLPAVRGPDALVPFYFKGMCSCSRDTFETNLKRKRVDTSRVTITEGFFEDTCNDASKARINLNKLALAWLDCDLYESSVPVLRFLTDLLVDGAVLVFDGWYCFQGRPDHGQQRACQEWLAANPHIKLVPFRQFNTAQSFIVYRDRT